MGRPAAPPRAPVVVGVDPGGRNTGIVVRWGAGLHWAALETREGIQELPDPFYLRDVLDAVAHGLAVAGSITAGDVLVAVEEAHAPNPHVRLTNPLGIIGTAMVVGAILGLCEGAITVPPAAYGRGGKRNYPAALWGDREKRGTGRFQHCRSAWDIAGMATRLLRSE